MRKILFFSLLVLGASTLFSCQSSASREGNDIPVDVVFDKWNIRSGMLQSMDITLKGKNKSGDAVEVSTTLLINQYDEFLLPMLTKLEEEGQFKDGNTGSGTLQINKEQGNGKLIIKKVGGTATKNMEFKLDEEQIAAFMQ